MLVTLSLKCECSINAYFELNRYSFYLVLHGKNATEETEKFHAKMVALNSPHSTGNKQ